MKTLARLAVTVSLCTLGISGLAESAENKAEESVKMWAAFQCATFAELSENADAQRRLFDIGYAAGKAFYQAVEANQISDEQVRSTVPVAVSMTRGPNVEFLLGRIFERAMQDAFDAVVKKDTAGQDIPVEKWIMEYGLRKMVAEGRYRKGNCSLIR